MEVGMIFGIIFAVIVVGVLVAVGFNYIMDFFGVYNQGIVTKQAQDITAKVGTVAGLAMGSVDEYSLKVPGDASICFVDPNHPGPNPSGNFPDLGEAWIKVIIQEKTNMITLGKTGSVGEKFTIKNMVPEENFCVSQSTKLNFRNEGRFVSVSRG